MTVKEQGGAMSAAWKRIRLEEVADDVSMGPFGSNIKVDNFISEGVPVIRGGNLNEFGLENTDFVFISEEKANSLKRSLAYPDDLVFTHRGTIGQVGIIPHGKYPKYLVSQSQMKLTVLKEHLDPRYLYYFFKSTKGQYELLKNASQVGVPAIASPTRAIKDVEIDLPPLESQRRIATILSGLDEKIEMNRQINQTLEAIAQALFKEWFVDFNFPGTTGEMQKSELGPIPVGWKAAKWGELLSLEYGKSLRNYTNGSGPYPVFGTNGKIGMNTEPLCPYPRIIIGRKGAYRGVHFSEAPFFVIDTAFFVKPMIPMELRWAYYEMIRLDINGMDSGSAIPSTSREDFYRLPVIASPIAIQQAFTRLLTPCWEKQQHLRRELQTLSSLRDTLLPKLMNGEIAV